MILIVDNGSSYIRELADAINDDYIIKRCEEIDDINYYKQIILSGRVKNDNRVNVKNIEIVRYCYAHNIPLLGICYGAEIIALALGGTIKRLDKRIHGLYDVIIEDEQFTNKKTINVFESHSYIISKLPKGFRSIGYSNNSKNEIITNGIILGTQFHPELTKDGRELISNFLKRKSIIS